MGHAAVRFRRRVALVATASNYRQFPIPRAFRGPRGGNARNSLSTGSQAIPPGPLPLRRPGTGCKWIPSCRTHGCMVLHLPSAMANTEEAEECARMNRTQV